MAKKYDLKKYQDESISIGEKETFQNIAEKDNVEYEKNSTHSIKKVDISEYKKAFIELLRKFIKFGSVVVIILFLLLLGYNAVGKLDNNSDRIYFSEQASEFNMGAELSLSSSQMKKFVKLLMKYNMYENFQYSPTYGNAIDLLNYIEENGGFMDKMTCKQIKSTIESHFIKSFNPEKTTLEEKTSDKYNSETENSEETPETPSSETPSSETPSSENNQIIDTEEEDHDVEDTRTVEDVMREYGVPSIND